MSTLDPQYPGNPSLPREVRDKILSTFRHTLNLFKESKTDDCLIGCDFILKMDPRFTPARQLLEKAKNPAADVNVAALESVVAETPTRQERVASVETDRLLVRAAESFNARDFDAAIASAEQVLQVLPGNHNAMEILEKARQKKTAAPQFEVARQRAMAALDGHRMTEARAALEKMKALDAEHPSIALLERRLSAPAEPSVTPPAEAGESTNPGLAPPPEAPGGGSGSLDDLSLDSLSLDEESAAVVAPPTDFRQPKFGPLAGTRPEPVGSYAAASPAPEPGGPPDLWSSAPEETDSMPDAFSDAAASSSIFSSQPSESFSADAAAYTSPEPELPSQQHEIQVLLAKGDEAAGVGNRQQAIEIWSRIFLIDINNSEAVGRIEKARQEMAEGNKRIAESLRRGREKFEAGDFTAAREAFLEVAASDETDATARSYLDRIEQELARPSSGLDLSRKTPQGDILAEELAETPGVSEPDALPAAKSKPAPAPAKPRGPIDKRFAIALGVALLLAVAVGAFYLLRPGGGKGAAAPPPGGGPSLEHATMLFREGKLAETIAELRQIPAEHPDYARAQKLLASLTRKTGDDSAPAGSAEAAPDASKPATGPPPEAVALRAEGEKALAEKRYIDALKSLNLAASAFQSDPTYAPLVGAASERVAELTPAVKLYNEGEYETAVPILWRIFQQDRSNQDARSYLLRCYYNQGIGQLQNGLYPKAVESFNEVLSIEPNDADATRHKKFAQRYLKGDLDLMGRIYVRHIQQRP
jgi:tetratricopeptide (TPR) repeat protein